MFSVNEVDPRSKEARKLNKTSRGRECQRLKKECLEKDHQETEEQLRKRLLTHSGLPQWRWQAFKLGWNGTDLPKNLYFVIPDANEELLDFDEAHHAELCVDLWDMTLLQLQDYIQSSIDELCSGNGADRIWITAFTQRLHARSYAENWRHSHDERTCSIAKIATAGHDMIIYRGKDLVDEFEIYTDHPDITAYQLEHIYLIYWSVPKSAITSLKPAKELRESERYYLQAKEDEFEGKNEFGKDPPMDHLGLPFKERFQVRYPPRKLYRVVWDVQRETGCESVHGFESRSLIHPGQLSYIDFWEGMRRHLNDESYISSERLDEHRGRIVLSAFSKRKYAVRFARKFQTEHPMSLEIIALEPSWDRTIFHAGSIIDHMDIPLKLSLRRSRFEHHYLIVHSIPRAWIKAIEHLPLPLGASNVLNGSDGVVGCESVE